MMERDTYVRALPVVRPADLTGLERMAQSGQVLELGAFQSQEGADERTSGMDRSKALITRLIPFSVVWLVLTCGIVWKLSLEGIDGFLIFGVLTAFTYYKLDKSERHDSKHGVEHHRIDSATYLAERQMEMEQENRRAIVQAYIKHLEGDNNGQRKLTG